MQTTTTAPATSTPNQPFLLTSRHQLLDRLNICPSSQTLTALSPTLNCELVTSLPCNQWSCRFCAERKIRRLAARTRDAKPNRMLTLTVDPKLWDSPRSAFDGTRRQIPPLFAALRARFGEAEYLRATELTASGWPHYHFLVRSGYLPHAVIRNKWQDLTGARIVDVRSVKQTFRAYIYLVKYLSKLHKIEWTERHVSYSRSFFPPEPPPSTPPLDREKPIVVSQRIDNYLMETATGAVLEQLTATTYAINPQSPSL